MRLVVIFQTNTKSFEDLRKNRELPPRMFILLEKKKSIKTGTKQVINVKAIQEIVNKLECFLTVRKILLF